MTRASGAIPHPRGEVAVDLALRAGTLHAEVSLPDRVDGAFVWQGVRRPLHSGKNSLVIGRVR
jgi:hypothetical protein